MKTFQAKPGEIERRWYLVDASGQTLGRLASRIASVLRGKHKASFTPYVDMGDFVIVTNAHRVAVTGRKEQQKPYRHHSGHPGGLRTRTLGTVRRAHPDRLLREAVRGMLPKTTLGRKMLLKLKLYAGPEHPHKAQQPVPLPTHL
ncbi:MAG: 50S ribosomal protein L13 [Deltaproteobacteria bacterium]|nr:50S ribosomal protein L13 [Deltaproteobacteria bacterium]